MKKVNLLIVSLFLLGTIQAQNDYFPKTDCEKYNKFKGSASLDYIDSVTERIKPSGIMYFDKEIVQDESDFQDLFQYFDFTDDYTFDLISEKRSVLDNTKLIRKYQEYYKGIQVDGGGYTAAWVVPSGPGSGDPCKSAYKLNPSFLTEIDINIESSLSQGDILNLFPNSTINDIQLVIKFNLENQCNYTLVWKVFYRKNSVNKITLIDANTGALIRTEDIDFNLNAPTEVYGTKFLLDHNVGGGKTKLESPNGQIKVYANENPTNWASLNVFETTFDSWSGETTPATYQLFHCLTEALPVFSTLGFDFNNVYCSTDSDFPDNAATFTTSNLNKAYITFGRDFEHNTFKSFAVYDIVSHELGHAVLLDLGLGASGIGPRTLHEGIADMFGSYVESQITDLDWVIGSDIPEIEGRDLSSPDPSIDCYTEVDGGNEPHERAIPLGYWYYLAAEGGTPHIGLKPALEIVLAAVQETSDDADYGELMRATLDVTEEEYGKCSKEFAAMVNAWEEICIETDYTLLLGAESVCEFQVTGSSSYCEENNDGGFFTAFCINGGLPGAYYRWSISGKNSTGFTSLLGMQGATQNGGSCLYLTSFPDMPWYPQQMKLKVYCVTTGEKVYKRFKILDCDGDDLTCSEYYNQHFDDDIVIRENKNTTNDETLDITRTIKVFDYMGKVIYEGETIEFKSIRLKLKGLFFVSSFDAQGKLVKTIKVYL